MKKCFAFTVILILLLSVQLYGQDVSDGTIPVSMDFAQFRASDGWVYLELYFSFPREGVEYLEKDNRFISNQNIEVDLFLNDSLITTKSWKEIDQVDSLGQIRKGQFLNNQVSFYIQPGMYEARVRISDLNRMTTGWIKKSVEIRQFSDKNLEISDIELSLLIQPDTTKNKFVKNGFKIIPNPQERYGIKLPILYYYCEFYNLSDMNKGKDSSFTVKSYISDSQGKLIFKSPDKTKFKKGNSVVDVGNINITTLQSGSYNLNIQVIDNETGSIGEQLKEFSVYRPADFFKKEVDDKDFKDDSFTSEFAFMDEDDLKEQLDYVRYISTSKERRLFKKLDLEGKRKFMAEFWQKRDDNPLTKVNEYKLEYMKRMSYANQRFSRGRSKGWKTDQGRVHILFGRPDKVDTFPSSLSKKGYDIWYYYEIEGGSEFVFVDISNTSTLILIHSTVRSEVHDYQWQRLLY